MEPCPYAFGAFSVGDLLPYTHQVFSSTISPRSDISLPVTWNGNREPINGKRFEIGDGRGFSDISKNKKGRAISAFTPLSDN
jgi:hypothetical protein